MPRPENLDEHWYLFLKALDDLATEEVRLDCIGGFVVTVLYGAPRTTGDLDVLEIAPGIVAKDFGAKALEGGELHHEHGIYLDRVTVVQPPHEYESRLKEMFPGVFQRLRLMALDPYDIVLTKLVRNIQRDRDDVLFLAHVASLDLQILEDRYKTELRPYLGIPEREDLTMKLWKDMIEEDRAKRSTGG